MRSSVKKVSKIEPHGLRSFAMVTQDSSVMHPINKNCHGLQKSETNCSPQVVTPMIRRRSKTVLLIEDNPAEELLVRKMFNHQGSYAFQLNSVICVADAIDHLAKHQVDVVLLDTGLKRTKGQEAVKQVRKATPRVSIVLLFSPNHEGDAIHALQEGAQDYLVKGQIEPRELMRALRNAVERKKIEEALFQEKERALVTLNCIADAVICTDLSGNISFLNPIAEKMTGWPLVEAKGRPLAETLKIMDATTHITTPNPMAKAVAQDRSGVLPANCILVSRDGHEIFIEDSVAPIHDRGGLVDGSVLVFRDVTEARALGARVAHLAEHDALTGLPNRLLLNDRLDQAIAMAHRNAATLAVLFMDLDGFKHINDSLGHSAGDKLLQSIAKRLLLCVRGPDTISRQGGDEFLVVLQDIERAEDAAIAAKRILKALAETHSIDGHDLQITASIGVSIYPDDGMDSETLIKNADTAMYQAKAQGRHTYKFFKPEMNTRAVNRQSIEEDLRRALKRNEFTLHYQPRIDFATGEINGAEALLRWKHPKRGLIPPAQFIPIAEDSGLMVPIGAWVLRQACKQVQAWEKQGLPLIDISVNVSTIQLRNGEFLEELLAILSETGLEPRRLELEVTESALMRNSEFVAPILRMIRKLGVRISVDDFGTGYSSLSYLQQFSLDAIKIDQSFVRRITSFPADTTIVSAIISLGQSRKLRVIAEGVETAEALAFLKTQDCDEAQGYYFSVPLPAMQFAKLLETHVHGFHSKAS
jgi:diguanylate cyclase (GGDEF)-like protein/PAS domain S-box-containing protein